MKATVTTKGQVTIPHFIRDQAKIVAGSQLDFQMDDDGNIIIRPINKDITNLKGIVKSKQKKPVTLKQMKIAIQEGAKSKFSKIDKI